MMQSILQMILSYRRDHHLDTRAYLFPISFWICITIMYTLYTWLFRRQCFAVIINLLHSFLQRLVSNNSRTQINGVWLTCLGRQRVRYFWKKKSLNQSSEKINIAGKYLNSCRSTERHRSKNSKNLYALAQRFVTRLNWKEKEIFHLLARETFQISKEQVLNNLVTFSSIIWLQSAS